MNLLKMDFIDNKGLASFDPSSEPLLYLFLLYTSTINIMARSWYAFIGGDDPFNPLNYFQITVKHRCLCGNEICAIYAKDNGLHPEAPLSLNLQQYIKNALITEQLQPEVPFNAKKYVYLKY